MATGPVAVVKALVSLTQMRKSSITKAVDAAALVSPKVWRNWRNNSQNPLVISRGRKRWSWRK